MDDNKTQGGGAKRRPLRFRRRPFVKDFLRFLLGLSLKNKLAHNKRPEGSSKPTRVATNLGLRQYSGYHGLGHWILKGWKLEVNSAIMDWASVCCCV